MSDWFLVYLVSLVCVSCVLGCSDVGGDPSLPRVCRVACEREVECVSGTTVAQCVSDCVAEAGPVSCDRDDAALEACTMQMATWSCDALALDELPPWCQNVCRAQRLCGEDICAEFPCTEQGIRDAIAFGYGPNTFRCEGPTTVAAGSEIVIDNDVILDGEGDLRVSGDATHRVLSVAPSPPVPTSAETLLG